MNRQCEISFKLLRLPLIAVFSFLFLVYGYGQQVPKKVPGGLGYLEYLPPGYSTSTELYPCIVFLHGAGERGDGSPSQVTKVAANGTPKFIKNGATMCFDINGKTECFIVLSPQQTTNYWSWTNAVIPFMKYALANYRIDPNRLYLTGLSMGGGWDTTYDPKNNPNIIAAFAPVSTTGDYNGAKVTAGHKIPVWAFHGDKDNAFTLFQGKAPLNGMNSVGANPAPIWTIVPGGGHSGSTWDKTFSPTHTYYNPNMYEWFLTHKLGVATPKPPTVYAGADKSITLPISTTSLTGTATDPDGTIVSKIWTQSSGPNTASIVSPTALTTNVTGLIKGTYVFSLSATDNSGLSSSDLVTIQVLPAPTPIPPTADAGLDKQITEPDNSVSISGSGKDTDGTIVTYTWTQTSGPNTPVLTGSASQNLVATGLVVGSYTFTLTVLDDSGLTGSDQVIVVVLPLPPNNPPVANAGLDDNITLPITSIALTGLGTDSDGSIALYTWSQSSGPSTATIATANTANTNITNLAEGVYVFTLTVTDNKGVTGVDQVIITVFPLPPNSPPTADAGPDASITLPISTKTLTGSATDTDGTITKYAWVQTSGPNTATIVTAASAVTVVNNLIEGSYVFTLTATDNIGAEGSDQVILNVFPVPPNQPPTAFAGSDENITLPVNTVTLTGIGTDTDGTISIYSWTQQSGPSASTIVTPALTSTKINNLTEGVYVFEFTVTDNKGSQGSDIIVITVFPAANIPPSADAGTSTSITLPNNSVSLTGKGSDSDGTIVSFEWEQVNGPSAATINGASLANATMGNLVSGIYTFSLTVTDNDGAKATAQVGVTVNPEPPNKPPVAEAGDDKFLTLPTNFITLNGSGSDPDGTIESYLWSFVGGPGQGTSGALDQPSLSLSSLVEGIYVFKLTVTDNKGETSTDEAKIFVDAQNIAPVSLAGSDQGITLPINSVTLAGSGSDSDGTVTSSVWEQISGPNTATFEDAFSLKTKVSGLVQGIYTFSLRVTDNDGVSDSDQLTVVVNPTPPNIPPVANVSADQEITLPINSVSLTGSGTDLDGTIASYKWSRVSGPNTPTSTLVDKPTITYSGLVAGSYVFRLSVKDNKGAVGQKDVKVKVNPQPVNIPPVADAGQDQEIVLPVNSVTLTGKGTDSDGTIEQYKWLQINGPSIAVFSTGMSATTQAETLVEGIYVFRLVVTDNKGVSTFDEIAVTVKPIPFNLPPVSNAGGNKVITLPTTSTSLMGSGTDSDGTIVGYTWSQVSGPSTATTTSLTQANITLSALATGFYVFRLTVRDNKGSTGFDEINILVQPVPANQPPTADAGLNKVITIPTTSVAFSGSGNDPDGTISKLEWTAISGPTTAIISGEMSSTLSTSSLAEGTYIFRLTVTDNLGAEGFDEVNVRVNPTPPNIPPTSNAGDDISITLPTNTTTITGVGTDSDGTISIYSWSLTSGPNTPATTGLESAVLKAENLITGIYIFKLTVTDDDGLIGFDEVKVTVNPLPNNIPPVAYAGVDQSIVTPPTTASLEATATDSDGTVSLSVWTQVSGPNTATIVSENSLKTLVSNLIPGTYIFRVSATDDRGATAVDEMTLDVSTNKPPVAFAGDSKELISPDSNIQLNGGGTDSDGTIVLYEWTQVSGSAAGISGTDQPTLTVSGLVNSGAYVFRLTVTDNNGATNSDEVQIDVRNVTINKPPVAKAGDDAIVHIPDSSIQLQGSAIDSDGTINTFLWTQVLGPSTSSFSDNATSDPLVSDLIEGIYIFELTVTDNGGAIGNDQVRVEVSLTPNALPTADAGENAILAQPKNSIQFNGTGTDTDGTIISYSWSQVSGPSTAAISDNSIPDPIVNELIEGVYVFELTVKDNSGATATSQITIAIIAFELQSTIFPKVFSPNGDGISDKWTWPNVDLFDGCEVNIYTRFGKKVFGMTSYDNSWDGTASGVPLESEAYYFIIKCGDGQQTTGGVRIVR